ncbi:thioredoxin family protein [Ruficoccus amylovorans]|uniref:Thioredoxin family protein n=1 Tax=Ruficoccus amylovorans TaxID=1804625 RepID=A0A842HCG1_9BACT|nr:thioredoxin family protein [Ruficoccus amylovorans]MBC2593940.1 thioredoxin family protein [Ruficoccus amylovorans]
MRRFLTATAFAIFALSPARAAETGTATVNPAATNESASGPTWMTDYSAARQIARGEELPMLVYFTASWCQPCQMMKAVTLKTPEVVTALGDYVTVLIDIDAQPQVAEAFGVSGVPNFQTITPGGQVVSRLTGYREAPEFAQWLSKSRTAADQQWALARQQIESSAELRAVLRQRQTALPADTMTRVFALTASRDPLQVRLGLELLTEAARRDPALLSPARYSEDLQVRVVAAQVLERTAPSLGFDPWLPPSQPVPQQVK